MLEDNQKLIKTFELHTQKKKKVKTLLLLFFISLLFRFFSLRILISYRELYHQHCIPEMKEQKKVSSSKPYPNYLVHYLASVNHF